MKNVTLSSVSHSARRRGCTLVVNLNPAFSFIRTTPAGTEALKGEIILHMPGIYHRFQWKTVRSKLYHSTGFIYPYPKKERNIHTYIHTRKLLSIHYAESTTFSFKFQMISYKTLAFNTQSFQEKMNIKPLEK